VNTFLVGAVKEIARITAKCIPWSEMTTPQRYICIRGPVSEIDTQEELERRLQEDFGIYVFKLNWYVPVEDFDLSMEIKQLHILRQGLFAQNGACVTLIIDNLLF